MRVECAIVVGVVDVACIYSCDINSKHFGVAHKLGVALHEMANVGAVLVVPLCARVLRPIVELFAVLGKLFNSIRRLMIAATEYKPALPSPLASPRRVWAMMFCSGVKV
jgi:altronate dehydratase